MQSGFWSHIFSSVRLLSLVLTGLFETDLQRREHYKNFHSPTVDGKPTYYCGKCPKDPKYVFTRHHEFIRHMRSKCHFDENYLCRCGSKFPRPERFRQHVQKGECQGFNAYACFCGHSVQSYTDALALVSIGGHIHRCDDPRPRGRPKKNSFTAASN